MTKTRVNRSELVRIAVTLDSFGWGYLRFEEDSGFVSIASDFGHWAYHWSPLHRGDSLGHFLAGLHIDYAGGKFLGAGLRVQDAEATEKNAQRHILELRRHGSMSEGEARDEWIAAGGIETYGIDAWMAETRIADAYELIGTRMDTSWVQFWERIWLPGFVPVLKEWPKDKDEARAYEAALVPARTKESEAGP